MGQRIATTDIYGNETQFIYNEHGLLVETRYPIVLDENGRPASPSVKTHYNVMGHPVETIDARGFSTHQSFNIRGQPVSVTNPDGTTLRNSYSFDGYLEQTIAANGARTRNHFDYAGRSVCQETYAPDGALMAKTHAEYDAFHLLSETDAMGNQTLYTYDFAGRLASVAQGNARFSVEYDPMGRIARRLDYSSSDDYTATAYGYDGLDRVIEEHVEDAQGNVQSLVRYGYDARGNRNEVRHIGQAGEALTRIIYNAYQEPEIVTDPEGNVTRTVFHYFYYNAMNQNVIAKDVIDPLGNTIFYEFDALGRLVLTHYKDPYGNILRTQTFRYDLAGNRTYAIEGDQTTHWQYDSCNRLVRSIDAHLTPAQKITVRQYNSFGQLDKIIKQDGVAIRHAYDGLGRLATLSTSDQSVGYVYHYDANNNVIQVEDTCNHRSTYKTYDANNRVISETLGNGLTNHYAYDGQGRLSHVTLPDGSGTDYAYTGALLKTITRGDFIHTYAYDQAGQVIGSVLPGQAGKIAYTYDRLGRVRDIDAPFFREKLDAFDAAGRLVKQTLSDIYKTDFQTYAYDALHQILQENGHTYAYDSHYNCISKDGTPSVYNALNQLLEDGSGTYRYDRNGNLIQQKSDAQEIQYKYDALDRLTIVTSDQQKCVYTYR